MKVSKREQWLLFGGILVGVLYVFVQMLAGPQFQKIGTLKSEIKIARMKLEALKQREKQIKGVRKKAPKKSKRKTKEEISISVISYITDSITNIKLSLVSLKPNYKTTSVKRANLMRFDLIVEGKYNQIYKFINVLEESPDLIVINLFKMVRKTGNTVTASISFSVYY